MNLQDLYLVAIVSETGLDDSGSLATDDGEFGLIDSLPQGWEIIGPGNGTVDYGRFVQHHGVWKFELTSPLHHAGVSETTPDQRPTLRVRDLQGVEHEIPVAVTVLDDNAVIRASSRLRVVAGDDVASRLTVEYGADGAADDSPLGIAGVQPSEVSNGVAVYQLEHGVLELDTNTNTYVFKAAGIVSLDASVQQSVTFVAKDGDGDLTERTVVITITKPPLPGDISLTSFVDEAGMDLVGTESATDKEFGGLEGLPEGWSVVGAGNNTVSYGQVVQKDGVWFFELTQAVTHTEPGKGDTLVQEAEPTVLIQDAQGNTYEVPVSVTVADDAPFVTGDSRVSVQGGASIEGDLEAVFGADGPAPGGITVAGLTPDSVQDDIATYATQLGVLSLNTLTGKYTFAANQLPDGSFKEKESLTFVVTDADNDTVTLDVDLVIYANIPPPDIRLTGVVREAGLDVGQRPDSDLEFGGIAGLPEGWSFVSAGDGVDYGRIVEKDGGWFFELTEVFDHASNGNGTVLTLEDTPYVIVQDENGLLYEIPVTISVVDDTPEVFSLADEYIERYQTDLSPKTASGVLEMTFGADGAAAADAIEWDAASLGALTSKGKAIVFSQEDGVLTALADGDTIFTLSLSAAGEYVYTQYGHIDSTSELTFDLLLRDGDGDTRRISEVLIVHIDTDVPDDPAIEVPPADDRFVLLADDTPESINGRSITGNVLANDNDPAAMLVSVTNGSFGRASVTEQGKLLYTLDADAASRMPGGTGPVYDELVYTAMDGAGNTYTRSVQVIINRVNNSDEIYLSDNKVDGETLVSNISLKGGAMTQPAEILGSDGSDSFIVNGFMDSIKADLSHGDNTLDIRPGGNAAFALKSSTVLTGSGNDSMTVAGLTDASAISMGDGDNIFIGSSANDSTTTLSNSTLTMGDGDDVVRLSNTVTEKHLTGANVVSERSLKLFAMPTESSGGTLDKNTQIDLGAGNNQVELLVNPGKSNASIRSKSEQDQRYQVYDDTYTAMNSGSVIRSNSQSGELTKILVDSSDHGITNDSHIYVLGGDADITVKADRATDGIHGGNLTVALFNGSSLETADGQDSININSTGYALYQNSHVITGDGHKLISLHSRATETVIRDASSIQTGKGDDSITLSTSSQGGEVFNDRGVAKYDASTYAVLMGDSFINAGGGDNVISISSTMPVSIKSVTKEPVHGATCPLWAGGPESASFTSYAINDNSGIRAGTGTMDAQRITVENTSNAIGNNSYIVTGGGNDTISVRSGTTAGGHTKYTMYNGSYIDSGNGRNNITVTGEDWGIFGTTAVNSDGAYPTGNHYKGGSRILSGLGDDTISVTTAGRNGSAMAYSSYINAGEGNNSITVTNNNGTANFGLIHNSGITAGNGNDTVKVTSWTQALHSNSYVRLGDGDNSVTLTGKGYNDSYALMSNSSSIQTGSGADVITLTGPGNGMRSSLIQAGDGNNSITITATQGKAVYSTSRILTGVSDDSLVISGATGVASNSELQTAAGNDTLSINATAQQALHTARADTGTGDDQITLTAALTAAYSSTITTGTGDDVVSVTSKQLHGFDLSTLNTGEGNDIVTVNAANATGTSSGLRGSSVLLGDGHDAMTVSVTGKNVQGISGGDRDVSTNLGSGNDELVVSAIGSDSGSAMIATKMNNSILAGDGNDSVILRGSHYAMNTSETGYNEILMGDGDDTVGFAGMFKGAADKNIVDGGIGGEDELRLFLNGASDKDAAILNSMDDSVTITNMENVVLDIFEKDGGTLELTQAHLDTLYASAWARADAPGESADVYIYGKDSDTLDLTVTGGDWQQSGTHTYEGVTYDRWLSDANQELFVIQEIMVLTA